MALLSHGMGTFHLLSQLDTTQKIFFEFLSHFATPTFILLFGMMLELVYHPKLAKEGTNAVVRRLLQRSLLCYLGYLVIAMAWIIKKNLPLSQLLETCLFLEKNSLNAIFKFWTVALLLAIPLLFLRKRKGLIVTVCFCLGTWLIVPLLNNIPWPARDHPLSYLTAFLLGKPSYMSPISLLHSMPLIGIGMFLGQALLIGKETRSFRIFYQRMGWILVLSFAFLLMLNLSNKMSIEALVAGYRVWLRYQHHLSYYTIGLIESLIGLLILSWIMSPKAQRQSKYSILLIFGRSSLLAYILGNLLLIFWPNQSTVSISKGFFHYIILMICLSCVLMVLDKLTVKKNISKSAQIKISSQETEI